MRIHADHDPNPQPCSSGINIAEDVQIVDIPKTCGLEKIAYSANLTLYLVVIF